MTGSFALSRVCASDTSHESADTDTSAASVCLETTDVSGLHWFPLVFVCQKRGLKDGSAGQLQNLSAEKRILGWDGNGEGRAKPAYVMIMSASSGNKISGQWGDAAMSRARVANMNAALRSPC